MIEFLEEEHLYIKDGMIVPSVSEILRYLFPNKYANINPAILNRAAEFGTHIHEAIENYENGLKYNLNFKEELVFNQYLKLKIKHNFKVIDQEQMVSYEYDYCGRFDMISERDNKLCLADIKTTAKLDLEYLSWQLSLYEYAYGQEFDGLVAIWLPKRELGKYVEIERKSKEEIEKLLIDFKKRQ